LDTDILEWFRLQVQRGGGGNYQTLINNALREHIRAAFMKRWKRLFAVSSAKR